MCVHPWVMLRTGGRPANAYERRATRVFRHGNFRHGGPLRSTLQCPGCSTARKRGHLPNPRVDLKDSVGFGRSRLPCWPINGHMPRRTSRQTPAATGLTGSRIRNTAAPWYDCGSASRPRPRCRAHRRTVLSANRFRRRCQPNLRRSASFPAVHSTARRAPFSQRLHRRNPERHAGRPGLTRRESARPFCLREHAKSLSPMTLSVFQST